MGVITRFALRNPVVIVLLLLLVTAGGAYSAFNLRQESFPDISLPLVIVTTTYPGSSASDVLNTVTKPLEAALSGVPGVQALDSTSADGISRVVAQFDVGSNGAALKHDAQDALNGVALPSAVSRPQVVLNESSTRPIMIYSVTGAGVARLTDVARGAIVPRVQALPGVASVTIVGATSRDVLVTADPLKLKQYGVSVATLDNAIMNDTPTQPVGAVTVNGVQQVVGAGYTPDSLAAVRALPVVPPSASLSAAFSHSGGAAGRTGGAASSGGSSSTLIDQATLYLNAARVQLIAMEGPSARNCSLNVCNGPLDVPLTDIVQSISDLHTTQYVSNGVAEARGAERALARLATQHSAYNNDLRFTQAEAALASANTTLGFLGAGGKTPTVGDVATVSVGSPGAGNIVRSNGRAGVLIQMTRNSSADPVQVTASIRHALAGLALPPGIQSTRIFDVSDSIASSIGGATRDGLVGALLAVIIIGLFLGNWRATLIAVVTIPVAFLLTLMWLNVLGLTLNIITLAGFAVAVGRVVDDSIVVIENLYRRISAGEPVTPATILAGTVDVGNAITSSTATTVCVFLPLAFVAGIVSIFFAPFAWTVTVALLSSYLAAVTIVPLMAYALFRGGHLRHETGEGAITRGYRRVLAWSLDHRAIVLIVAALTVLASLGILRRTPTNLLSQTGPASAVVNITAPVGATVQTTGAAAVPVERRLASDHDIASFYTTIGDTNQRGFLSAALNAGSGVVQNNQGTISVNFNDGVHGDDATARLRTLLSGGHYAAAVDVHKVGDANSALEVDITGSNSGNIRLVTRQVEDIIRSVGSVDNLIDTLAAAKPQLDIRIDPTRAARYGLTPAGVVTQLQASINGVTAAHVMLNGAPSDLVVSLAPSALSSPTALAALPLSTGGSVITLGDVAAIQRGSGVVLVTRHDQQLAARVLGSITGTNVGGISTRIDHKLRALHLPGDTVVTLAGVSRQQSIAFSNVYTSMLVAVLLVFIVMVLAFRALAPPIAILFALPVTAIGAIGGLTLGRQALGLPALIGFLMLIGIVVTNAIVLMTRVQQFRQAGLPTRTALLDAGANRLRPIMMTAVATIGALAPLALGLSEGNLISQSLADAVIGGLFSSTVLTLVVVPVVFSLLAPHTPSAPATAPREEAVLVTSS